MRPTRQAAADLIESEYAEHIGHFLERSGISQPPPEPSDVDLVDLIKPGVRL